MSSILGAFAIIAVCLFGRVSSVPCGCPTPTEFSNVILQACNACPTIVVSAPSQTITVTEYSLTSSSIYCPTLGTYTCPTGVIVPTTAPCYATWVASCTLQCELAYTDFIAPTTGCVADLSIYINDVCIESGTTQWPPSPPSPTGAVSPTSNSNGANSPSSAIPTPSGMSPSSNIPQPASSAPSNGNMATGLFPTKTAALRYAPFVLSTPLPSGRASWMRDNAAKLAPKLLKNICLPGSHDSGTYGLNRQVVNLNGEGVLIAKFVNYLSVSSPPISA